MFNRLSVQTQTKLVKTPKPDKKAEEIPPTPPIDYVKVVRETGKDAVIAIGALVGGYVVLDTVRQVTVAIVKAKV
jgi:hypothetical protein